ncbi:site-specific integrase [Tardiphaga robiniae]|uniref:Site-specific integrase n=1 Tax=Tardiphaga robiniae TaxID=943830 RepID=A0A7G6TTX8_9BRAD|nr:site-specific integrase [Tardiphaga robiniae]QND70210.1 site-specific integrase [Tardiphaga robiniae]
MDEKRSAHVDVVLPDVLLDREAAWLKSPYSDPVWIITDTRDSSSTRRIDFQQTMADGRSLVQFESLYRTVKEYAWWARDPRFGNLHDAEGHYALVQNLIYIAHALTLRGINSFADVSRKVVLQLQEEFRYGIDAVVHASERIDAYAEKLSTLASERDALWLEQVASSKLTTRRILTECNLPQGVKGRPEVSAAISRLALTISKGPPKSLRPEKVERKPLTYIAIGRWMEPLAQLYGMRGRISAHALTFKPWPKGLAKTARRLGVGTKRTLTPKPRMTFALIEYATTVLGRYACPTQISAATYEELNELLTACWVIIAAFTARRVGEIRRLRDGHVGLKESKGDCLLGDDEKGWFLWVYIEKTERRHVWIPVTNGVARAIETLRIISQGAREKSGDPGLFQRLNPFGEPKRFYAAKHLDRFAKNAGAIAFEGADVSTREWHWAPHQFRRFFAVLYFYRSDGASIETLSHMLRHFSLRMTRQYIEMDPELQDIWSDVEWGFTGELTREIAEGGRVSGAAGDRLMSSRDRFRRNLNVVDPEEIAALLQYQVDEELWEIVPMPWGTCTCPSTAHAASKAACRGKTGEALGAVGADRSEAEPALCAECPHFLIKKENAAVVDAEIAKLQSMENSPFCLSTVLGAWQQERLIALRGVREKEYSRAKPDATVEV